MTPAFNAALASAIRSNPGQRAYDYAMLLNRRGISATETRVNRALEHTTFKKMIRKGMVATHDMEPMTHARWFLTLPKEAQDRVPRVGIAHYAADTSRKGLDTDISLVLRAVSKRGVSAYAHHKRIMACSTLAAALAA